MPSRTKPQLMGIATDVLGDLAFMIADDEPQIPPAGTVWLQGEVSYQGVQRGAVTCWVTRSFAVQLAANLLGTDPNDSEALTDAEDAVREFLNVLCGNLVTAYHGTTDVYNLTIPSVAECLETPHPEALEGAETCSACVDGEPIFVAHVQTV